MHRSNQPASDQDPANRISPIRHAADWSLPIRSQSARIRFLVLFGRVRLLTLFASKIAHRLTFPQFYLRPFSEAYFHQKIAVAHVQEPTLTFQEASHPKPTWENTPARRINPCTIAFC